MPFFIFIAGVFFKKRPFLDSINNTMDKLIVPAFLYIFIMYVMKVLVFHENAYGLLQSSIKGLLFSNPIKANNITWFLFSLAWVKLISNIWFNSKKKASLLIMILMSIVIFYQNLFFIKQSVVLVPFYLVGAYLAPDLKNYRKNGWMWLMCCVLLLLTIVLTKINGRVDILGSQYGDLPFGFNFILFYVNGLVGSFLILFVSQIVEATIGQLSLINVTSSALISILGLQRFFLDLFLSKCGFNPLFMVAFIYTVVTILCCVICHRPISKVLSYFTIIKKHW